MSIKINDNRKPNFVLREGALLQSTNGGDYGILILSDEVEEKYNVLLLNTNTGYPETVYSEGISLDRIEDVFVGIENKGNYDLTLTIGN